MIFVKRREEKSVEERSTRSVPFQKKEAESLMESGPFWILSVSLAYAALLYRWTSTSFVPAEAPFKKTSSLYFPAGHPSGFEMWNSVLALPVGAIV